MARTYGQFIDLVRSWSNRDAEVLPNERIADFIRYAADKAYRTLRVPPLEHTVRYDSTQLTANTVGGSNRFGITELCIPEDLIEFHYIRGIDINGQTTRMFNEKADIRTFYDLYAEKYNDLAVWSRHGSNILIAPGFGLRGASGGSLGIGNEECIELHYYRRLPAFNAYYDVSAANANVGLTSLTTPTSMPVTDSSGAALETVPMGTLYTNNMDVTVMGTTYSDTMTTTHTHMQTVYGNLVPNWLRDENERVVLMGALAEAFFFLQENEESQKYAALFQAEIMELNKEDQMRHASGGNVQVNFNGRGLI